MTTTTYQKTIKNAQSKGYTVTLLFFWLNSEELAISRVKQRVREGGHNIPEETIRRRYHRGISNLFTIFLDICNNYVLVDNSEKPPVLIADKMDGVELIYSKELLQMIKNDKNEKG